MSEETKIPWCDSTWNPFRGCDKVSPGCEHCYITTTPPFRASGQKHGDPIVNVSEIIWGEPFKWNKRPWVCYECGKARELDFPNHEQPNVPVMGCSKCSKSASGVKTEHHRRRVFAPSLSDFLHPGVPVPTLARFFDTIRQCQDLNFLLCTKRPELWTMRIKAVQDYCLSKEAFNLGLGFWLQIWLASAKQNDETLRALSPPNVWLGATVEDKPRMKRIEQCRQIPARVHFLSLEPLLEDLGDLNLRGIDWVIVGGESGKDTRPCNVEWIRNIMGQCKAAGVPCFVKQLGSWSIASREPERPWRGETWLRFKHPKGGDPSEWSEDMRVRQFPEVTR